jgi:FG-GAP-like repeat
MLVSRTGLILVLALLVAPLCLAELGYTPVWDVSGKGGFSAPNMILNPAPGITAGIVVMEVDFGVVCFDAYGKRLWDHPMAPPSSAAPAIADIDGDGQEDVVAVDSKGNLVALDRDGTLKWRVDGATARVVADSRPAIADLDGDGRPEIIVGDTAGTVSCFAHDGALYWQFSGNGTQMGPVLIADLYDLPGQEIIVTSHDFHIYALSAQGRWLWDIYTADDLYPNSTPILADVNGDNTPELYVGGGLHHFYGIDLATGRVATAENIYLHINGAISAGDIDGDGSDEVVFGTKGGAVWCHGAEGFKWTRELRHSYVYTAPLLVDCHPSPGLEVVIHSAAGDLKVLDGRGEVILSENTTVRPTGTPLIGDLDNDGMLEILTSSLAGALQGNGNMVWASLGVKTPSDMAFPKTLGRDRPQTGQWPETLSFAPLPVPQHRSEAGPGTIAPVGQLAALSGTNTWRFDVDNPEEKRLLMLAEIADPQGVNQTFARHVLGKRARTSVSFNIGQSGAKKSGRYNVTLQLLDAEKRIVRSSREHTIVYKGLKTDEDYLESVLDETEQAVQVWKASNPSTAGHFELELVALKGMLSGLDGLPPESQTDASMQLRRKAKRLRDLAVAGTALAPTGSFFAWKFCPWAYFDATETLPAPASTTEKLEASLLVGEYESLALNLTNVSGHAFDIRVTCGEVEGPSPVQAKDHIEFRRAVTVPNLRRKTVADALPALDEAGLLRIGSLESQQLWITLNAEGLTPGAYTIPITMTSVEPDATEVTIPLVVTVHDLALPRPRPLRFCQWAPGSGVLGIQNDAILADQVAHGVSVHLGASPGAAIDADGNLTGPLNFEAHDASVKRLSPHGFLLFVGAQGSVSGAPMFSEAWKKGYIAFLREWVKHMEELGLGYGDWALYPYDEPSTPYTETSLNLVKVAKATREADPNILIYTDPTSGTTMESVEMWTGLIDIWCPSAELLERLGPELVPVAKRVGKEVWFYDASGRSKTLSSLGIYRWRFWYAWNQGFTGAGWWTYAHGEDQWSGWNEFGDQFSTVYAGTNGVVTSKRWEAAREGIEDYELLWLLRDAIAEAEKRGAAGPNLDEARAALAEVPKAIEKALLLSGRRLPLTPDSVPLYEETTSTLEAARQRLIKACLGLKP